MVAIGVGRHRDDQINCKIWSGANETVLVRRKQVRQRRHEVRSKEELTIHNQATEDSSVGTQCNSVSICRTQNMAFEATVAHCHFLLQYAGTHDALCHAALKFEGVQTRITEVGQLPIRYCWTTQTTKGWQHDVEQQLNCSL